MEQRCMLMLCHRVESLEEALMNVEARLTEYSKYIDTCNTRYYRLYVEQKIDPAISREGCKKAVMKIVNHAFAYRVKYKPIFAVWGWELIEDEEDEEDEKAVNKDCKQENPLKEYKTDILAVEIFIKLERVQNELRMEDWVNNNQGMDKYKRWFLDPIQDSYQFIQSMKRAVDCYLDEDQVSTTNVYHQCEFWNYSEGTYSLCPFTKSKEYAYNDGWQSYYLQLYNSDDWDALLNFYDE